MDTTAVPVAGGAGPPGSLVDWSKYVAVPARIIHIPGTELYIVTPADSEQSPPPPPPTTIETVEGDGLVLRPTEGEEDLALGEEDKEESEMGAGEQAVPVLPPAIRRQIRRRGRPPGKTKKCGCPNCAAGGPRDRHICHFPDCGRTFTKTAHLEAHLNRHLGVRPYVCPEPDCEMSYVRAEELKRHYFVHKPEQARYRCPHCSRRYHRTDHFNLHVASCAVTARVEMPPAAIENEFFQEI